jgi:hypothetical protein
MVSVPRGTRISARKSSPTEKPVQRILRRVSEDQAFRFYRGIDEPIGESAVSLADLFKKIEKVDLRSLSFHQARGDFERWIREVLGDGALSLQIGRISKSICGEALRVEILRDIESRLNDFRVEKPS